MIDDVARLIVRQSIRLGQVEFRWNSGGIQVFISGVK